MKSKNSILGMLMIVFSLQAQAQSNLDNQIVSQYLEIKNALVATDAKSAQEVAGRMLASLDGNNDEMYQDLTKALKTVASATDIQNQRNAFSPLSQEVYKLAKAKETNKVLYWQYCPMALGNTGANWLSAEEQVLNPYFGNKMLKCGMVKETLN